jgi:hypothetical protein
MKKKKQRVVDGVTLIRNKPTSYYGSLMSVCVCMSSRIPFAARWSFTNASLLKRKEKKTTDDAHTNNLSLVIGLVEI